MQKCFLFFCLSIFFLPSIAYSFDNNWMRQENKLPMPSVTSIKTAFESLNKNISAILISLFPSIKTDRGFRNVVTRSSYIVTLGCLCLAGLLGYQSWRETVRQLSEFESQGVVGKNMRQLPRLFCMAYASFMLSFFGLALVAGANRAYEASNSSSLL